MFSCFAARRIETGPIDLSASLTPPSGSGNWRPALATESRFDLPHELADGKACYLYFKLTSGPRQSALLDVDAPGVSHVWQNGVAVGIRDTRPASAASDPLILDVQPGGNDVLVRLTSLPANPRFGIEIRTVVPIQATLPEKLDSALLAERLREALTQGAAQTVPEEFITRDWPQEARDGDASQGRRLFAALACAKCHAITADQQGAGAPSLSEARRRFTVPHLVESILLPSKQVAEPFRATTIITIDGKVLSGLITGENAEQLELLAIDATRRTIRKGDIDERSPSQVSPMPPGLVKTPQELRDLLAYLASERPLPP